MGLVRDRTNEEWLGDLRASGPRNRDACETLRAFLIQRLEHALRDGRVDVSLVEDFAQDAIIKILGALDRFRGDSRFTTWATAIAIRTAYTELRRARWKDRSLEELNIDEWHAASTSDQTDELERDSLVREMRRVIEQELTPKQRKAVLGELAGMPQVALAEQLGTNRNALYKLHHDARKKLRRGILNAGYSEEDVRRVLDM